MRIILSLKRGSGRERAGDVDRKWEGREGGIKQREGEWNQKKAFMEVLVGERIFFFFYFFFYLGFS